jgi:hypothetical protein
LGLNPESAEVEKLYQSDAYVYIAASLRIATAGEK